MEIRQLQYFVAMFEEGSVTKAARRTNVVQPAISQQLSKLERELGQPLFHRTPKGMVPTRAGEEVYPLIRQILQDLDFLRQELSVSKGIVKGHISVGAVSSVANNLLSEALQAFNHAYPEVTIRATGGYTADLLEMLRRAHLDIAIVNAPAKVMNFDQVDILREDFALISAPDNPLCQLQQISLKKIAQNDLVIPSFRHGLRGVIEATASAHNIRLRPRMEFDEIGTIEDFVQHSGFLTILPPIAVKRALQARRLRQISITPVITRKIVCATSSARPINRATQLFIELLRAQSADVMVRLRQSLQATHSET